MKEFCKYRKFDFIDVIPALNNDKNNFDNLFLNEDYSHYNEEGHTIIAKYLSKLIPSILD